jgi:hypothetical protein
LKCPKITWVKTTSLEILDMKKVDVGDRYYSMTVQLEKIGYYNPNAVDADKHKEFFIEGIDYFNATDAQTIHENDYDENKVIHWSQFGVNDTMTSDYKDAENHNHLLNESAGRYQVVLKHLNQMNMD